MKKNLIATFIFISLPILAIAKEYTNQEQFLKEVPQQIEGVEIVSPSKMNVVPGYDDHKRIEEMKKNGFIKSNNINAAELMGIKTRSHDELSQFSTSKDPYDTHLKSNLSDIKLAFPYKDITSISKENKIGYAPIGTVINSGEWTGIKEFFEDKNLGTCAISIYHIKLSKMGIKINAEAVSYVVNNYPTTQEVEGNEKSGFMYTLSWVSPVFSKDLECASKIFDPSKMKAMVAFANRIESEEN